MANKKAKNKNNVKGKFYCTDPDDMDGCILCALCGMTAPEFFTEDEDGNRYVWKQPETEDEILLCEEALEGCPVDSIGKDGDE